MMNFIDYYKGYFNLSGYNMQYNIMYKEIFVIGYMAMF